MSLPDSLFYLSAIISLSSQIWYKKQPLGKNSLSSLMKSMSEATGLTGRHTNHSVRGTMILTLRKKNVEPLDVIAIASQRNLKSLDSYSSTLTEQQKNMSLKLSNYIQTGEAPKKSFVENQVKMPKVIPQGLFLTTANSPLQLLMLPFLLPNMPQYQTRNSKESCPLLTVMMNFEHTT